MSNNHLLEKNLNEKIVANIFSSLVDGEKWEMLIEMFRLQVLNINARDYKGRNALYWAICKNKTDVINSWDSTTTLVVQKAVGNLPAQQSGGLVFN